MYILIGKGLASKAELDDSYTLDEALKLYWLWRMTQDIEAAQADEMSKKVKSKGRK